MQSFFWFASFKIFNWVIFQGFQAYDNLKMGLFDYYLRLLFLTTHHKINNDHKYQMWSAEGPTQIQDIALPKYKLVHINPPFLQARCQSLHLPRENQDDQGNARSLHAVQEAQEAQLYKEYGESQKEYICNLMQKDGDHKYKEQNSIISQQTVDRSREQLWKKVRGKWILRNQKEQTVLSEP